MIARMNIAIITASGFSVPSAVSNRLNAYGRGLNELGNQVTIITLTDCQTNLRSIAAEYPSINYVGLGDRRRKHRICRIYSSYLAGRAAARWISLQSENRPDAVIYYGMLMPARIPISKICEKLSIPTFDEITEYPFVGRQKKWRRRLEYYLFMQKYLGKNSGILCISNGIIDFIEDSLRQQNRNIPIMLFGLIVETDKFACQNEENKNLPSFWVDHPYIVYCGNMYGNKDGVPDLIKSFALANEMHPDLHLVIIGDNSNVSRMAHINAAMDGLSCKTNIHFTGRVEWSTLHAYMCNALALVLAKPKNIQNEGAFPTKLGEYLACGKPVICTSVGDIPLYLQHNENALLAEPGNTSQFAEQICRCVEEAQLRVHLAKNALLLAESEFSHKRQAEKLQTFILHIINL